MFEMYIIYIISKSVYLFRAKKKSDLVLCDIRGDIIPVLKSLRADLTEASSGIREESILLMEEVEELEGEIGELEDRGVALENR